MRQWNKPLLIAALLILVCLLFVPGFAQNCPNNQPPCFRDQIPMSGHGGAASLPPDYYTPCGCADDNRRVIIVRIDQSWNVDSNGNSTPGNTNVNVWNATVGAIDSWNNAQDAYGNKTGYFLALDQSGGVGAPDIVITRQQPATSPWAEITRVYPFEMHLAPINGSLGSGVFTLNDLTGRVAHELGHRLGLTHATQNCPSVMRVSNVDGTRAAGTNNVGPTDVLQVNNNLRDDKRPGCNGSLSNTSDEDDEAGGDSGGGGCESIDADGDGFNSCVDCNDNHYDPSNNCDPSDGGGGGCTSCDCYYEYGYIDYEGSGGDGYQCWYRYKYQRYVCNGQVMGEWAEYEGEYCDEL
jgi:hypothetical protein